MAQRNLTDKEIEELLDIATPKIKVDTKLEDVKAFIGELGIKSGKTKVPNAIIYFKYCSMRETPLGRSAFFRYFKQHFTAKVEPLERFYMLSPTPFDLSIENKFKARTHTRKERQRHGKKETPR